MVRFDLERTRTREVQCSFPGACFPLPVRQQHDLTQNAALAQHLVRALRLIESQTLSDQRLDLLLFEQVQEPQQVMAKPRRFDPQQPLYAVGTIFFRPGLNQLRRIYQLSSADSRKG